MAETKFHTLRLNLPLFPTTTVGSFPKPDFLKKARARFSRDEISAQELHEREQEATEFWIKEQERIGIDVLVDGEMYRGDMVAYFAETIHGFKEGGLVRSYGNRYYHKPVIVDEIRWDKPITVDWWKFAQNKTSRPVKGMLTGPYTIMDWSFNEFYPDRRAVAMALAREIRKEVEVLIEAGAKIIQIDEPAVSVRPEELMIAVEAMQAVTRGLPAYFITHICYGAFDQIYPNMLNIPVDNFDLEMSNSGLDMLDRFKKDPFTKDISFGVVDVHSHKIESAEQVAERVRDALKVLRPDQIWLDPDCGLKTREVDEAIGKLEVIAQAARQLRTKYPKPR